MGDDTRLLPLELIFSALVIPPKNGARYNDTTQDDVLRGVVTLLASGNRAVVT